jgi:hypothetical protein
LYRRNEREVLVFSNISAGRAAKTVCNHVMNIVKEFGFGTKVVGRTYNAAVVMMGHVQEVSSCCFHSLLQSL